MPLFHVMLQAMADASVYVDAEDEEDAIAKCTQPIEAELMGSIERSMKVDWDTLEAVAAIAYE